MLISDVHSYMSERLTLVYESDVYDLQLTLVYESDVYDLQPPGYTQ